MQRQLRGPVAPKSARFLPPDCVPGSGPHQKEGLPRQPVAIVTTRIAAAIYERHEGLLRDPSGAVADEGRHLVQGRSVGHPCFGATGGEPLCRAQRWRPPSQRLAVHLADEQRRVQLRAQRLTLMPPQALLFAGVRVVVQVAQILHQQRIGRTLFCPRLLPTGPQRRQQSSEREALLGITAPGRLGAGKGRAGSWQRAQTSSYGLRDTQVLGDELSYRFCTRGSKAVFIIVLGTAYTCRLV